MYMTANYQIGKEYITPSPMLNSCFYRVTKVSEAYVV